MMCREMTCPRVPVRMPIPSTRLQSNAASRAGANADKLFNHHFGLESGSSRKIPTRSSAGTLENTLIGHLSGEQRHVSDCWVDKKLPSLDVVKAFLNADANKTAAAKTDEHGMLPLHWAMRKLPDADLIELLLEHCPDAAALVDKHGHLPLHHGMANQASDEAMDLVRIKHPTALGTARLLITLIAGGF